MTYLNPGNRRKTMPQFVRFNLLGDMNCDDRVDGNAVAPFVLASTDPGAFVASGDGCDIFHADADDNGSIDGDDVSAFTDVVLTSGS